MRTLWPFDLSRKIINRIGALVAVGALVGVATRPWTDAVPVNLQGSRIELLTVTSDWASDPMFLNGRVQQGPIYFNDCVTWVDRDDVVTHVQFLFAAVTPEGEIKHKPLPLDARHRATAGEKPERANCRTWGYANGADGLWLVAWPNVVDFADGTHWQAPPIEQMSPYILDALPRAPTQ